MRKMPPALMLSNPWGMLGLLFIIRLKLLTDVVQKPCVNCSTTPSRPLTSRLTDCPSTAGACSPHNIRAGPDSGHFSESVKRAF